MLVLFFFFISVDKAQHRCKQNDTKTDDKMTTHEKSPPNSLNKRKAAGQSGSG